MGDLRATSEELLEQARAVAGEVSVEEAKSRLDGGEVDLLIDVREAHEWDEGHIPGAVHAPRGSLEWLADPHSSWRDERLAGKTSARIILQCTVGGRSLLAAETMTRMGFSDVVSMAGGLDAWIAAGYPIERGAAGSSADRARGGSE